MMRRSVKIQRCRDPGSATKSIPSSQPGLVSAKQVNHNDPMDNLSACNLSASSLVSADSGVKLEERAGSAASQLNARVSTTGSPSTLLSESESVLGGFLGQTDIRVFTASESVYERKQTRIPTSLLRRNTLTSSLGPGPREKGERFNVPRLPFFR